MSSKTDKKYFSKLITQRFLSAMSTLVKTHEITVIAFGEIVGFSSSNITRLKEDNGVNTVTLEAVARMCDHFNVSPTWLFTGKGKFLGETPKANALDLLKEAMQMMEIEGKRKIAKRKLSLNKKAS